MFSDVHSAKINIPVSAGPGSNTVIAAQTSAYLYIHEIMGDLDVSGTLTIYCGSREQGSWSLDAGQGITLTDEPGNDGVPRFQCRPGEALVFVLSAGATFKGNVDYSLRQ
jgi:hypothetical protein